MPARPRDLLLADLAPARIDGRVVGVGRPGVQHVARADLVLEVLRIVGMERVLHRVEVIEVAEELVEAVHRRQKFVAVAEMVLAELAGGVAHGFERRGDGRRLRRHADGGAGLAHRGQPGADRQLAGDEIGAARRAARLGVIVGEQHAFGGELVEVRRLARHDAAVIGADIEPADVVAHDEDDVGLAARGGGRGRLRRLGEWGFPPLSAPPPSGEKKNQARGGGGGGGGVGVGWVLLFSSFLFWLPAFPPSFCFFPLGASS